MSNRMQLSATIEGAIPISGPQPPTDLVTASRLFDQAMQTIATAMRPLGNVMVQAFADGIVPTAPRIRPPRRLKRRAKKRRSR